MTSFDRERVSMDGNYKRVEITIGEKSLEER